MFVITDFYTNSHLRFANKNTNLIPLFDGVILQLATTSTSFPFYYYLSPVTWRGRCRDEMLLITYLIKRNENKQEQKYSEGSQKKR